MGKRDNLWYRHYAILPVRCDCGKWVWRKWVWKRTFHYYADVWKTHYKTDREMAGGVQNLVSDFDKARLYAMFLNLSKDRSIYNYLMEGAPDG
jgi:hypothetical protein